MNTFELFGKRLVVQSWLGEPVTHPNGTKGWHYTIEAEVIGDSATMTELERAAKIGSAAKAMYEKEFVAQQYLPFDAVGDNNEIKNGFRAKAEAALLAVGAIPPKTVNKYREIAEKYAMAWGGHTTVTDAIEAAVKESAERVLKAGLAFREDMEKATASSKMREKWGIVFDFGIGHLDPSKPMPNEKEGK